MKTKTIEGKELGKLKLLAFNNYQTGETALISRHNSYLRVYLGSGNELFYSELGPAITFLISQGYTIDLNL